MDETKWQVVTRDKDMSETTQRLPVPGGWLYRSIVLGYVSGEPCVATTFVPERAE